MKIVYDKITMVAPAQIANFGGLFDRAGKLCRHPPLGEYDVDGGPGNWMQVERLAGRKGVIELEVYLRKCDSEGYWDAPVLFTSLMDEIRAHPNKDIVRILVKQSIDKIEEITGKSLQDGFRITLIIHTPNGKTGLGLGGSASSSAIVVGIDAIYGTPIANSPHGQTALLRLIAEGERVATGRIFFDNVAPLVVKGDMVYIAPYVNEQDDLQVIPINCPPNLHVVTITPEFAISTETMTTLLQGKSVGWRVAENSGDHKMEVMRALLTQDLNLLIRHATNIVTEPIRGTLIKGYNTARELVRDLNHSSITAQQPRFALGISGSGPTMYVMTRSAEDAHFIGYEIHRALHERDNVYSWWFCHTSNRNGAEVIGRWSKS